MSPRFRTCAIAGATAWLVACGGGAAPDSPAAPGGDPAAGSFSVQAAGTSASTVTLAWAPVPGATGYAVQRQDGTGAWPTVAELPAERTDHVDTGLSAHTAYRYRVQALGPAPLTAPDRQATTTGDAAVVSPPGAVGAELARARIDAAGGRVASEAAGITVDVPPGAFGAPTDVVLLRQSSNAPGALGDGVQLRTAAAPARPLKATLAYGALLARGGDGLVIAAHQPDGTWLALPTRRHDPRARQIEVALPLVGAGAAQRGARTGGQQIDLSRVQAMYLAPAGDQLPVGQSMSFEPWVRVLVDPSCAGLGPECLDLPSVPGARPVLEPRRVPFTNHKPGYTREWRVEDQLGGSAALGRLVPQAQVGARYTAPQHKPEPNPVTVSFRSRHDASGRVVELASVVEVMEPVWSGTIDGALDGSTDLGFLVSAQGVWGLSSVAAPVEQFEAAGTQTLHVVNLTCTAHASPAEAPLPPGLLRIDRSTEPATYTLDVGSLWNTTIQGTCPGRIPITVPMQVPGQLSVQGELSESNTRIRGKARLNDISWQWDLKVRY